MSNHKDHSTRENIVSVDSIPTLRRVILSRDHLTARSADLFVAGVLNPGFFAIGDRRFLVARIDEVICPGEHPYDLVPLTDLSSGRIYGIPVTFPTNYDPDLDRFVVPQTFEGSDRLNSLGLYLPYVSHLRIIELNGDQVKKIYPPLVSPSTRYDHFGCEDPRPFVLDGHVSIAYNGIGEFGSCAMLAELDSTLSLKSCRLLVGPDQKHTCIFGEGSPYYMLARPLVRTMIGAAGIWLYRARDLYNWQVLKPVLMPRPHFWDSERVGPGPSPFRVSTGWLAFYYGVDSEKSYHVGAALLDSDDPSIVIARSTFPIFSPSKNWEIFGRRADTVFPCGVEVHHDNINLYYGAADSFVAVASMSVKAVLGCLS